MGQGFRWNIDIEVLIRLGGWEMNPKVLIDKGRLMSNGFPPCNSTVERPFGFGGGGVLILNGISLSFQT